MSAANPTDKPADKPTDTAQDIADVCCEIRDLLLSKNAKYKDSALSPARVFSRADPVEQLKVRIDDKLKRIQNRPDDEDEDVVLDLIGYLVLLRIARRRAVGVKT